MPSIQQSQSQGSSQQQSRQRTAIVPGMMKVYNQLLAKNTQNYNNVLGAYRTGQQNLSSGLQNVYGGFQGIESNVMNALGVTGGGWGVAAPAAQAIGQSFQQAQGRTQQGMVNAGLGNSTVLSALQNQNALQAGQAYGGLGSQLAQTAAGYMSQIGMARQGAMMQGLGMQSGLTGQYLGDLAGYHFANTAGSLTGGFGQSSGSSQQTGSSQGLSLDNPLARAGGGGRGGAPTDLFSPHNPGVGAPQGYDPYLSYGFGGSSQPPGYIPTNISYSPTPESAGGNWAGMNPGTPGGGYDFGNAGFDYSGGTQSA